MPLPTIKHSLEENRWGDKRTSIFLLRPEPTAATSLLTNANLN